MRYSIDTATTHPLEYIMYTDKNFKSKAELKRALAAGERITCHSPGPFPCPRDGRVSLEGPHYPKPHTWYTEGMLKEGVLVSIK
jgi:hypothetical protein